MTLVVAGPRQSCIHAGSWIAPDRRGSVARSRLVSSCLVEPLGCVWASAVVFIN